WRSPAPTLTLVPVSPPHHPRRPFPEAATSREVSRPRKRVHVRAEPAPPVRFLRVSCRQDTNSCRGLQPLQFNTPDTRRDDKTAGLTAESRHAVQTRRCPDQSRAPVNGSSIRRELPGSHTGHCRKSKWSIRSFARLSATRWHSKNPIQRKADEILLNPKLQRA